MKKVLAVALAAMLLIGMMSVASAATITINRDASWDPNAESAYATYTPYKIFDAVVTTNSNGGTNAVYTISGTDAADKITALDSTNLFKADLGADGKYYITLKDAATTGATVVAALKTMVENNPSLFPAGTATTSNEDPVVITLDDGYYLITASNGKDLVLQTIGIENLEINEKSDYPKLDKKQKKEADPTYAEAEIPAEIGSYIDFQVTVSIPVDANKAIRVFDSMTDGLEYDAQTGLTLAPNVTYTDLDNSDAYYNASADWQIIIADDVVAANQGTDIVITYRAKVTEAALTDTGRENEVTLYYDNNNYILKDKTNYTTYFGGIEKVDGADNNIKLDGVKFEVTVGQTEFNVTPVYADPNDTTSAILYYVPGGSSNEVVTGTNGLIIIRGLDNDKTYTLTETETKAGYNLLPTPKNLTLEEDTGDAYSTTTYDKVENNKGAVLPSTGGIGTTIFYVAGLIMVLGAATILIARRKADAE